MTDRGPREVRGGAVAGVVFDMDGVIIDSEDYWHEVRRDYVARHGGRWGEEDQRAVMGANSRQWARHIRSSFGLDKEEDSIIDEVVALLLDRYEEHLPVIPGAIEVVEAFAERYPLAVASSSPKRVIDWVVGQLDLEWAFPQRVSSDEVERGKPEPDVYLLACRRLGVDPEGAVAVEDSASGIRSAKNAGLAVIAVPNPSFPPEQEALEAADRVVDSIRELGPELVDDLGRRRRRPAGAPSPGR